MPARIITKTSAVTCIASPAEGVLKFNAFPKIPCLVVVVGMPRGGLSRTIDHWLTFSVARVAGIVSWAKVIRLLGTVELRMTVGSKCHKVVRKPPSAREMGNIHPLKWERLLPPQLVWTYRIMLIEERTAGTRTIFAGNWVHLWEVPTLVDLQFLQ